MSLKKQALSGIKWTFLQQFSVQVVNFIVQIILARLLMPEMFGLIAMILIFVSIGQMLVDNGMTSSLVRTRNINHVDYSTVFFANILITSMIYLILYFAAPYIAEFYNQSILIEIIRIMGLIFVIKAISSVQIAKLTREMNFKLQMKIQIPSSLISGMIGIYTAYNGFGVWSIVFLNLTQALTHTIITIFSVRWYPTLVFNLKIFKYHLNFGYKLTLAGLIDTVFNDSYRIIIGKYFSPASVGFFNQAENMRIFPVEQMSTIMGKVTYPLFSNIINDEALKNAYRISAKLIFFVTAPMMFCLILIAEEGFRFLFGEKWLPAVPFFKILAIASIFRPVSAYNLNILKAKGKSSLILKIEIIKKTIGLLFIVVGFQYDIIGLIVSLTLFSILCFFINIYFCSKLIFYTVKDQILDIAKYILLSVILFILLSKIKEYLFFNFDFFTIFLYVLIFLSIYLIIIFKIDKEIVYMLKSLLR